MKVSIIYFAVLILTFYSCQSNGSKDSIDKPNILKKDTTSLKISSSDTDLVVNGYRTEDLEPIRENFKRLNSIPINEWSFISTIELPESSESGTATYYSYKNQLDKLITRQYVETRQKLTEYYLNNGKLSFVLERELIYNRPIYFDEKKMKENNDTTFFDIAKSELIETRSYFKDGKLIHQINNEENGSSFAESYIEGEQKRIFAEFINIKSKFKF